VANEGLDKSLRQKILDKEIGSGAARRQETYDKLFGMQDLYSWGMP
jgi:hypothetical protein